MITITYITQLIFSGQDMHTRGSTTQCLSVVMWQYFSFRTITQLANKNQYFGNNLNILIFRKLLIPNLYLYWEWVRGFQCLLCFDMTQYFVHHNAYLIDKIMVFIIRFARMPNFIYIVNNRENVVHICWYWWLPFTRRSTVSWNKYKCWCE